MSQKTSLSAIGGFVLIALGLVVFAAIYFGSGSLFRERVKAVSFFPGAVTGLNPGAPVELQGVQVGEVKDIRVVYSAKERRTAVPVYMEIWPDTISRLDDAQGKERLEEAGRDFVIHELGLRARLESKSFVTGQQNVALDFMPDTPAEFLGLAPKEYWEIPAVESTFDRISRMIDELDLVGLRNALGRFVEALNHLAEDPEIKGTLVELHLAVKDARRVLQGAAAVIDDAGPEVTRTLAQARSSLETAEDALAEIKVSGGKALVQAESTLETAESLIDEDSRTRHNLNRALEELGGAAAALRNLAEYMTQNPDALLRGRNP